MPIKINFSNWILDHFGQGYSFNTLAPGNMNIALKDWPLKKVVDFLQQYLLHKDGNIPESIYRMLAVDWKLYLKTRQMQAVGSDTSIEVRFHIALQDGTSVVANGLSNEDKEVIIKKVIDSHKGTQMQKTRRKRTPEEKTIRAIQRRVFDRNTPEEFKAVYQKQDKEFLIELISRFFEQDPENTIADLINIKVQHYCSDANQDLETWDVKQLLDFYYILEDGAIDHRWVLTEAKELYHAWMQGGPKKIQMFKSNKYKIKFNAETLTVTMKCKNALAPDKYIWVLDLSDILMD